MTVPGQIGSMRSEWVGKMRRVNVRFPFVVALCGLLAIGSGCATLKKAGVAYPSASVRTMDVGQLGLTSLTLNFDIDVKNPYTVALPVVGLDFALSSGGSQFLSGKVDTPYTIAAGAVETLKVPIKVPYREMYDLISGVEGGKTIPYKADFGLSVDAPVIGSVTLPLDAEGELSVPKL